MDSLDCNQDLFDLINGLAEDSKIEMFLLQNNSKPKKNRIQKMINLIKEIGFFRLIDLILFISIVYLERKLLLIVTHQDFGQQISLDPKIFKERILLTPIFSEGKFSKRNIFVSYGDEDIEKIQNLKIDLILRGNGSGIFKGRILNVATKGILSFHHGDNSWNRGGPPGFWEVYLRKPGTGFVIQILNERLDDGDIIFKGEVPTQILYTLNQKNILQSGNPFMIQIIKNYAANGILPNIQPKKPFSNSLLRSPRFVETLIYIKRTVSYLIVDIILKRNVLRRRIRWSVAFLQSDWKISNLSLATTVTDPEDRYFADPFVASYDNLTAIFVEDFSFSKKSGTISAIQISADGSYEVIPDIIKENFHLSFPFIFEFEKILYMIPESAQSKSIRLYKCVQFPNRWEYMYDIMQNVNAVDSMIFNHSGMWWLLTNMAPDGSSGQLVQLCIFSALNPLSKDWQKHPKNPVVFAPESGRNGGLLRDTEGNIFRVRQKQGFDRYGEMFSIAKITKLDLANYEEEAYCEINPKFFHGLAGTHHMHSLEGITVFDFAKEEILK
jgi:hypothetical protein